MNTIENKRLRLFVTLLAVITFFPACETDGLYPGLSSIEGVAYDALTYEVLEGATVYLKPAAENNSGEKDRHTFVDSNGKFEFTNVTKGIYLLRIETTGYKLMFSGKVDTRAGDAFVAMLPIPSHIPTPVGGITGTVIDQDGKPVANANVSISAQNDEITNGYFSTVCTNTSGQFFIGAIPLQSTKEFKVRCIVKGYQTTVEFNVPIQHNEMNIVNFRMQPEALPSKLYHEGFESGLNGWEITGLWRLQENMEIRNSALPKYVKSAPNDLSEGRLPDAYSGRHFVWYGDPETGNYLGEQSPFDYELSGGTGLAKHSGTLTSPIINLAGATEASINFWTWFEIESVNPNHSGYDLMKVFVLEPSGSMVQLGKLNPYTDPIIPDRKAIPFTSGGFNQAPVWKYHEFDLSEYAGKGIKIIFEFDTRDGLYNGYRGWLIDEISIIDKGLPKTKSSQYASPPLMERRPE